MWYIGTDSREAMWQDASESRALNMSGKSRLGQFGRGNSGPNADVPLDARDDAGKIGFLCSLILYGSAMPGHTDRVGGAGSVQRLRAMSADSV